LQNKEEYISKLENYIDELENRLQELEVSIERPSQENVVWKIRHRQTGLWSNGGSPLTHGNKIQDHGQWTKNGKFWKQKGALTNHIRNHTYGGVPKSIRGNHDDNELLPHVSDWEIVAFSTFEASPMEVNKWWVEYLIRSKS